MRSSPGRRSRAHSTHWSVSASSTGRQRIYRRKAAARGNNNTVDAAAMAPETQISQVGETRNSSRGSATSALKHGGNAEPMWPRHISAGWGGGSRLLRSHMLTVLAGRVGYALCMLSLCGRPGERAPGGAGRMPNMLDVSTLHGRPEAGRPARAPEAHHDDATFPPPAPPCLAAREPRVGLEDTMQCAGLCLRSPMAR